MRCLNGFFNHNRSVAGCGIGFVFCNEQKTENPTVVTELLTTKYNKRLDKLSLFLKKNQIQKMLLGLSQLLKRRISLGRQFSKICRLLRA